MGGKLGEVEGETEAEDKVKGKGERKLIIHQSEAAPFFMSKASGNAGVFCNGIPRARERFVFAA